MEQENLIASLKLTIPSIQLVRLYCEDLQGDSSPLTGHHRSDTELGQFALGGKTPSGSGERN